MEALVELLRSIEQNEDIKARYEYIPEQHKDVIKASELASAVLITNEGKCNWLNIELLSMEGFGVFPIEKDGFGWLLGGIQTRKGVITYC